MLRDVDSRPRNVQLDAGRDTTVELWGIVESETSRQAVRVVAELTPRWTALTIGLSKIRLSAVSQYPSVPKNTSHERKSPD